MKIHSNSSVVVMWWKDDRQTVNRRIVTNFSRKRSKYSGLSCVYSRIFLLHYRHLPVNLFCLHFLLLRDLISFFSLHHLRSTLLSSPATNQLSSWVWAQRSSAGLRTALECKCVARTSAFHEHSLSVERVPVRFSFSESPETHTATSLKRQSPLKCGNSVWNVPLT